MKNIFSKITSLEWLCGITVVGLAAYELFLLKWICKIVNFVSPVLWAPNYRTVQATVVRYIPLFIILLMIWGLLFKLSKHDKLIDSDEPKDIYE